MDRTQDRSSSLGCRPEMQAAVQELADRYRPADLPAGHAAHEEPGGCGGSHAGRAAEGVPEGRRISRRCGAVIVDLPHHVQHRDVAAAAATAPERWPSRSAIARLPLFEIGRAAAHAAPAGRLVAHAGRSTAASAVARRVAAAVSRAARDLPGAGRAARHPGADDRRGEQPVAGEGSDAEVASASRAADAARAARGIHRAGCRCTARRRLIRDASQFPTPKTQRPTTSNSRLPTRDWEFVAFRE